METINSTQVDHSEMQMTDTTYSAVDVRSLKLDANEFVVTDEVGKKIEYFLHKFQNQYSTTGPLTVSFPGPLDAALNNSLFDSTSPRPLVLYLHDSVSVAVNIFCQYVLLSETVTDYLSEEFLVWMWDRTRKDDYSTLLSTLQKYTTRAVANNVAAYPIDAYPLLVCLSVHQDQIDIVTVIQGTMSRVEAMAALVDSRKKFDRRAELPYSQTVQKQLVPVQSQITMSTLLLKPCTEHSSDIDKIMKDFNNRYMRIIRIDRVENALWLPPYLEQKKVIDTRLGQAQNEHFLFHGCSRFAAEEIIQHGFDHKLIGRHGTAYGHGFYFSPDHSVSHFYTTPDLHNDNVRTMLLCRVLIGRSCMGTWTMRKCPDGYDSTTDGSNMIYVVYSNGQILPEYVITYKENDSTFEDIPFALPTRKTTSNSRSCILS